MGAIDVGVVLKVLEQVQLSGEEITLLQEVLARLVPPGQCLRLIEEAAGRRSCPACGGNRCHRCGQANGLQRYRCVACRCSFNALTWTPLTRPRLRDKWRSYLQCLVESATVRKVAARVTVAKSTSFRWRAVNAAVGHRRS